MREGFQCSLGTFKEKTNILINNKQKDFNSIDENKHFLQKKLIKNKLFLLVLVFFFEYGNIDIFNV